MLQITRDMFWLPLMSFLILLFSILAIFVFYVFVVYYLLLSYLTFDRFIHHRYSCQLLSLYLFFLFYSFATSPKLIRHFEWQLGARVHACACIHGHLSSIFKLSFMWPFHVTLSLFIQFAHVSFCFIVFHSFSLCFIICHFVKIWFRLSFVT